MVFLKIIRSFISRFRNYNSFKFFSKIFLNSYKKKEKHSNSENIEDFSRVQRQIYCKIVQVYLNLLSSKKYLIQFYIQLFKDLKPMLSVDSYFSPRPNSILRQSKIVKCLRRTLGATGSLSKPVGIHWAFQGWINFQSKQIPNNLSVISFYKSNSFGKTIAKLKSSFCT